MTTYVINPITNELESAQPRQRVADKFKLEDLLTPGPLKDELKGDFDPTQETYEEYLRRINLRYGGSVETPKRGLVDGPGSYAGEHSFKPLTTAIEKAHYERQYGKKYNEDDWRSGNFGKKKVKRDASEKRSDFRQSLKKFLGQEDEFKKLSKRGYISIRELNKLLGGKDTQQAIDNLSKVIRTSPWAEEIKGVKNWKKSREKIR